MKKALLYGLSAVMLLNLTACGTAQANEPDPKHTTSAVQTEPPQETVVPSDKPDNVVEPLSANGNVKDATGTELYTIFEQGYQGGQIYAEFGLSEDELILMEIGEVESILGIRTDVRVPIDLEEQYKTWRAETHPATSTQALPAETQSSTDGQQPKPVGGTQQTGGGTYTSPTNTQQPIDNSIDPFLIPAGGTLPGYRDPSEDQSTTDAGYLPSRPEDFIYGN